jgi:hypothetical protein
MKDLGNQQIYFAHAYVTEPGMPGTVQAFEYEFLATSKDDAKEQMRLHVDSQLPDCVWNWEILIFTKDEELAFRILTKEAGK